MLEPMMDQPLLISNLITHAARYHAATEIISVETDGTVTHTNWGDVARNARRLGDALRKMGLAQGDRVGTLAWNNRRHLELYFGVSGAGLVTHTINPRLTPEQLIYIINHAQDRVLFFDRTFLPVVQQIAPALETCKTLVLMSPRDDTTGVLFHDEVIASGEDGPWPQFDERSPAALCYTSGTTGNPKGVLYTHRSMMLHTLGANQPDGLAMAARDTVLPVVPMFHVNAWGSPYIAAQVGARVVLPGPNLDGDSLARLIDTYGVTLALGVPTVWLALLNALEASGSKASTLKRTVIGGSALPPSMIQRFRDELGTDAVHAWGMTETGPLGTLNQLLSKHTQLDPATQEKLRQGQGRPLYGVELRLTDDANQPLPHDGKTEGRLQIRGHWVVNSYFETGKSALTPDGWFDTGDIATLDPDGYMIIRDRAKDIIKSGGEWISTVELENIAVSHPGILNAAAIAARHPKWDERPVIIAIARPGHTVTEADVLAHFEGKVAKWQIPDKVIFVDTLPLGGTGKVLKNKLRDQYGDVLF